MAVKTALLRRGLAADLVQHLVQGGVVGQLVDRLDYVDGDADDETHPPSWDFGASS
jgi:hypothetical protein